MRGHLVVWAPRHTQRPPTWSSRLSSRHYARHTPERAAHPWTLIDGFSLARGSLLTWPVLGAADERTDVFSLGATLYAMAFYYSPFECTFQGNDQRVVECSHLRVIGGAQFPTEMEYSAEFKQLIEWQVTGVLGATSVAGAACVTAEFKQLIE